MKPLLITVCKQSTYIAYLLLLLLLIIIISRPHRPVMAYVGGISVTVYCIACTVVQAVV